MFCVSITGDMFYRIEAGSVYCEAPSGSQTASAQIPLAQARRAYAELGRVLRKFDAEQGVYRLRG